MNKEKQTCIVIECMNKVVCTWEIWKRISLFFSTHSEHWDCSWTLGLQLDHFALKGLHIDPFWTNSAHGYIYLHTPKSHLYQNIHMKNMNSNKNKKTGSDASLCESIWAISSRNYLFWNLIFFFFFLCRNYLHFKQWFIHRWFRMGQLFSKSCRGKLCFIQWGVSWLWVKNWHKFKHCWCKTSF